MKIRRSLVPLLLAAVVALAGCGKQAPATPEDAVNAMIQHAKTGAWDKVYDSMTNEAQHSQYIYLRVVQGAESGGQFTITADEMYDQEARRATFVELAPQCEMFKEDFTMLRVVGSEVKGEAATVTAVRPIEGEETKKTISMAKVDGVWKITAFETEESEEGESEGSGE